VPHAALAQLYLKTNRKLPQARELLRTAVELEPTAPNYFLLGTACLASGDSTGAGEAISQALKLDPENATYRRLYDSMREKN
jgi:Flp pilus assembly protein TadD